MPENVAHVQGQGKFVVDTKFFNGTTALTKGQFICHNYAYGTAADASEERNEQVIQPSRTTNYDFAGVVADTYAAEALGQDIKIWRPLPGALCYAYGIAAVTKGQILGGICDSNTAGNIGKFRNHAAIPAAFGSVRALQTTSTAGLVLCEFLGGDNYGLVQELIPLAAGGAEAGWAKAFTLGGLTLVQAQTLAEDATHVLADGTFKGQRKMVFLEGAQTNNNVVTTITTGKLLEDTATAMGAWQTDTLDGVGDYWDAIWNGAAWVLAGHLSDAIT